MNSISWAKATGIPSLAPMQTSRVLLTISSPHPPVLDLFSSLSLKTPAKSVPPTPGTALQQKIQTNIEKSLNDSLNIHLQQQMGSFQASMLEAFQSLREELTSKKQTEVDQTSFLASKPGTSSNNAVNLDLPPPRSSTNVHTEAMDVEYGPALPPRLVLNQQDTLDQYVDPSELPPKEVSYSHKKPSHSRSRHQVDPGSASEQLKEDSDEPRIPSTRPKSTLTRVSTNQCPDMCHLLQGRISPLQPDTGLLSPLGLSPQGLFLIKTFHNMIQTPLIGK